MHNNVQLFPSDWPGKTVSRTMTLALATIVIMPIRAPNFAQQDHTSAAPLGGTLPYVCQSACRGQKRIQMRKDRHTTWAVGEKEAKPPPGI